jgi:hypothetical protein
MTKVVLIAGLLSYRGLGHAEEMSGTLIPAGPGPLEATAEAVHKLAEKVSENVYRIGAITVDTVSREIRFAGEINMATGMVEVVVCTIYGKTHESVISTKIRPLNLHLAMLLLGLKNGYNPGWRKPEDPDFEKEGWGVPPGDMVEVYAGWSVNGATKEVRIEDLIKVDPEGKPMVCTSWVFVGSFVDERGGYLADGVGSVITNWHDGTTVIDCPLKTARNDDCMYTNDVVCPPVKTPVEIRIVPARKEDLVDGVDDPAIRH